MTEKEAKMTPIIIEGKECRVKLRFAKEENKNVEKFVTRNLIDTFEKRVKSAE